MVVMDYSFQKQWKKIKNEKIHSYSK